VSMLGPKLLVGLLSLTASGNANPLTLDSLPRAKREMVTAKIAEIKTTLRENIQTLSKKKMPSLKGKSMDSKLMKFDEDDVSQHLRGLKMKDNFITYTTFLAEDCSSGTIYRTGFRLNYCLMNKDGSSFLYKVNKKQNFLVEFSYDGQNCKGIPTKANNFFLFSDPDAPVLDMCYVYPEYDDDDDDDGDTGATAMILQYASTFPDLTASPGYYVYEEYLDGSCSNDHTDFLSYYSFPVEMLLSSACRSGGGESYRYDTSTCSTTGQAYVLLYSDPNCATSPYYMEALFSPPCSPVDDDDDDDDMNSPAGDLVYQYCT
jgi:hypothetical protein